MAIDNMNMNNEFELCRDYEHRVEKIKKDIFLLMSMHDHAISNENKIKMRKNTEELFLNIYNSPTFKKS